MEHQQTIQVRIQVIDMKPQVLDLRVPVYLKASDLSQRIIRDAGLEPFGQIERENCIGCGLGAVSFKTTRPYKIGCYRQRIDLHPSAATSRNGCCGTKSRLSEGQ